MKVTMRERLRVRIARIRCALRHFPDKTQYYQGMCFNIARPAETRGPIREVIKRAVEEALKKIR